MDRERWLKERNKGLGGSDSPVVLGVSPFKTRGELFDEKLGLVPDVVPTKPMLRGTHLEPVAAEMYEQTTKRTLTRRNAIMKHKDHPFLLANIDRQIQAVDNKGPGVLEIKCPGLSVFSKCKREGLPEYYVVQLQHYLAVTDRKWGSFAVFNAERWELVFFDMDRDDDLINMIVVKDAEFWQMVKDGVKPEEITQDLKLPKVGGADLIKLDTPEWAKAIEDLRMAKDLKAEAEALEKQAKGQVISLMEGAEVAEGSGARIYYRMQAGRKSFDKKRLAHEHPEIDLTQYEKIGKPFASFKPYFLKGGVNDE